MILNEERKLQGGRLFSLTNKICMYYCCLLQNSTNSLKLLKKKKKGVYKSSHCVTLNICCSVLELTPTYFVFLLTNFLLKLEEQGYCICTSFCVVFLGGCSWGLGGGCWVFFFEKQKLLSLLPKLKNPLY